MLFRVKLLDNDNPYNPQPVDLTDLTDLSIGFIKPDGTTDLRPAMAVAEGTTTPASGAELATADMIYKSTADLLDQTGLWAYVGVARAAENMPPRVIAGTTPTFFWVQAQV